MSYQPRSETVMKLLIAEHLGTQAALASAIDRSQPYLSLLLRSQRTCSIETARAIVAALGGFPLTLDNLFRSIDQEPAQAGATAPGSGATVADAA